MRRHSTGSHFLEKKSAARKRRFAGVEELHGARARQIKHQLGK